MPKVKKKLKISLTHNKIEGSNVAGYFGRVYKKGDKAYCLRFTKGFNGRDHFVYLSRKDTFEDVIPVLLKSIEDFVNKYA